MTGLADRPSDRRPASSLNEAGPIRLSRSTSTAPTSRSCILKGQFDSLRVIAVQLEVNFIGTDQPRSHLPQHRPLHAREGFDSCASTPHFSAARCRSLHWQRAETCRPPVPGEAYYARDVGAHGRRSAKPQHREDRQARRVFRLAVRMLPQSCSIRPTRFIALRHTTGLDLLAARRRRSAAAAALRVTCDLRSRSPGFYRPKVRATWERSSQPARLLVPAAGKRIERRTALTTNFVSERSEGPLSTESYLRFARG